MEQPERYVKPGQEHLVQTEEVNIWAEAVSSLLEQGFHRVHEGHWLYTEHIRPICVCEISTGAGDTSGVS